METLWQDVKYGARLLAKNRGVTLVALVTLALGIGANTTIFSVVNAVLLKSLPYDQPDRIVRVFEKRARENNLTNVVSPADYLDWKEQNTVFEHMAAMNSTALDLTGTGEPERIGAGQVTAEFFDVLGVKAARGRLFTQENDQAGHDTVVVLSHGLWQRRFGSDPELVGKTLMLSGVPFTVIGVLPETFRFSDRELEMWVPFVFPPQFSFVRSAHFLDVYARLKPGVTQGQALAEMGRIASGLEQQFPKENRGHSANVIPLREHWVGDIQPVILLLAGAVGFVLLIACVNVANLMLARASVRAKEIAIRTALGAGRGRIVRQLLTENALLALGAGTAGSLLALWGVDAMKVVIPASANVPGLHDFSIDGNVLAFTAGISLLTGMLFGLAPALQVTRLQANEALKEGGRGATTGAGLRRLRGALVAGEVAMSLVLLAGAGLMMRTIQKIGNEHPGFNAEKVTAARVILPRSRYGEPRLQAAFFQQLLEKLRATPGVEAAGAISHLPLSGQESRTGIAIEGAEPSSTEPTRAHHRVVTTGYFETMRIPLIEGRLINESDAAESTPVMLVNQTMARKYWPGQSPVGRRVLLGGTEVWREVVGVVGDVKHWGMDKPVNAEMYLPEAQTPWGFLNLVVRSGSNEAGVAAMLREKMREIDKNQPAPVVRTMEAVMAESNSARRFLMLLLGLFAGVAMTLASVGIYGVMSYMVSQRTHEIGIRMALGAQREDIFRLIVGHGMGLTLAGVVVGLAGAFWLSRFLADQVFGVTPKDPLTLVGVAVLLTGVALAACLVPARRAASVEPMRALRYE